MIGQQQQQQQQKQQAQQATTQANLNNDNNSNKTQEEPQKLKHQQQHHDLSNSIKANYIDRSDIKPTRKRYIILLLFCLHSAINAAQWIYLSSITNTVSKFYRVDNMAINWTSMVYMLVYIPLVVPSTWLFERIGMRNSILLGSLGTTLGSLIKCFTCHQNGFALLMTGQTLVAVSQLFVLSVPPRLASVWFPDHQVSLANACGVFGNQFGIAIGFVLPPLVIGNEYEQVDMIGAALWNLFVALALVSALISLLIMFLFDHTPPKAPGLARLQQIKQEEAAALAVAEAGIQPLVLGDGPLAANRNKYAFGNLLLDLLSDANFTLLMASYGLNVGVFYAISTVLNQMVAKNYAHANTLVGRLGLLLIIAGMFGSVVSGLILDRTRKYRLVNATLYLFSLISLVAFALTLELRNIVALHIAVISLGYFMTGYLFIGYEMSNEITWPRPESVTAGLLNLSAQVFGVILTYLGSFIVDNRGNLVANVFFVVALAIGMLVTFMIRGQLKRQSAMDT